MSDYKTENYTKDIKKILEAMDYKLEYNMMYKTIDPQGIKLVIDFSSHDVGVARVQMPKTFYLELSRWQKANELIEQEIIKLKLEGVLKV